MTSPSAMHEVRVSALETLAILAGLTQPAVIAPECIPDLVRVSPNRTVLFVADAKATETPGCEETIRRLRRYLRAVRPFLDIGGTVRIAICHGNRSYASSWRIRLCELASTTHVALQGVATTTELDEDTLVTWVDIRGSDLGDS